MKLYHVRLGKKRTTVSLSETLAALFAFHLGMGPETRQATSAIQKWMQTELDRAGDPNRVRVSQWLQERILLEIVDKELSEKYFRWWLKEEDESSIA